MAAGARAVDAPQLSLVFDPVALGDGALVDEMCDATALLNMGSPAGIAEHVADNLKARRLAAARELVRRWTSEA